MFVVVPSHRVTPSAAPERGILNTFAFSGLARLRRGRSCAPTVWAAVLAALSLAAAPGRAEAGGDTSRMMRRAQARVAAADFEGALSLLRHARELTDPSTADGARLTARIELQRGEVLAAIGRHREAAAAFVAALKHDPAIRPDPRRNKQTTLKLFERIRSRLSGELAISADLPEAELWLDGASVGKAPYRARLAIGTHEVRATLLGREVLKRQVVVPARRTVTLSLGLEARCATLVVKTRPSGARVLLDDGTELGTTPLERLVPAGRYTLDLRHGTQHKQVEVEAVAGSPARVAATLGGGERRPDGDRRDRFWSRPRTWTWIALGGAALSLGVGLGFGAAADSDFDEYSGLGLDQRTRGVELESSVRSKATTANVLYGLSAAMLVTSVVLLLTEGKRPARRADRFGVAPVFGQLTGLQARARF